MSQPAEEKPTRLYRKSFLQAVKNSTGSNLFRNFYIQTAREGEIDAMRDGELSCAFFVSSMLVIFGKIAKMHATVSSTVKDLEESGWHQVEEAEPADVLVWEKVQIGGDYMAHIGFYVGEGKAISNSWTKRTPVEHDMNFSDIGGRKITTILRMDKWEDGQS